MKKIAAMMCVLAIVATLHFRYYFEIAGKNHTNTMVVDKVVQLTNQGVTVMKDGKKYYFPNSVFYYIEYDRGSAVQ